MQQEKEVKYNFIHSSLELHRKAKHIKKDFWGWLSSTLSFLEKNVDAIFSRTFSKHFRLSVSMCIYICAYLGEGYWNMHAEMCMCTDLCTNMSCFSVPSMKLWLTTAKKKKKLVVLFSFKLMFDILMFQISKIYYLSFCWIYHS